MELNIKTELSILPKAMFGKKEVFKIVLNDDGDTLKETIRKVKSGEFKQYSLSLIDEKNTKWCAQYLFEKNLREMASTWGMNTKDWCNKFVEITSKERKVNDEVYFDLVILPCEAPIWSEENI